MKLKERNRRKTSISNHRNLKQTVYIPIPICKP